MDNVEFQSRLRAGLGGLRLRRLRKLTIVKTAHDFIKVGKVMARPVESSRVFEGDEVAAVGLLLQMAGELSLASGELLSGRQQYAGAALLRQIVEIEYLTWTFKENERSPSDWLKSSYEERMKIFSPSQLRKTSKGRFLAKDYSDHCEQGGHPVPRGGILIGGKNTPAAQVLLADLIVHCWRIWDQAVRWSSGFSSASAAVAAHGSEVSWRLDRWGKRDPIYALMLEVRPEGPAAS